MRKQKSKSSHGESAPRRIKRVSPAVAGFLESMDQFETEIAQFAKLSGVEPCKARMLLRTFNLVDSFAATVAELMGKPHDATTARWAREKTMEAVANITVLVRDGPEARLAGMYSSLVLASENVKRQEFESAIQKIASIGTFLPALLGEVAKDHRGEIARRAANVRHDKPNGSRSKVDAIRAIWASGKYESRDLCAEEEGRALGMPFSTARRALRNTPSPA
jgi:hypothetical protein